MFFPFHSLGRTVLPNGLTNSPAEDRAGHFSEGEGDQKTICRRWMPMGWASVLVWKDDINI